MLPQTAPPGGVIDEIRARVERLLADVRPPPMIAASVKHALTQAALDDVAHPGLAHALEVFDLPHEAARALVTLAAIERSLAVRTLCSIGHAGILPRPTIATLAAALGAADPADSLLAPLTRLALIETLDGRGDDVGVRLDPEFLRLLGLPRPPLEALDDTVDGPLLSEHRRTPLAMAARTLALAPPRRPVVVVVGPARSGRDTVAAAIARAAGLGVLAAALDDVLDPSRRSRLRRDAMWHGAAVVIGDEDRALSRALARATAGLAVPVIIIRRDRAVEELASFTPVHVVDHDPPDLAEHQALWRRAAGMLPPTAAGSSFGPGRIATAARLARTRAEAHGRELSTDDLAWACRIVPAADFGTLARRLGDGVGRDDLILSPGPGRDFDRAIVAARHLSAVADRWRRDGRGVINGLALLFAGPPGTGKTLAAQILGATLGIDVHRVDLSQLVDKYVGETEKHLDRVFTAAADAEVVLFFDEAEALFGGRTNGEDSHGRYQNLQTGYLLQRIEQHAGVTVLATNQRERMDVAFARRMFAVIDFPAPGVAERRRLWRRYLPSVHQDDVDVELLAARFALTGAEIRGAVLAAELAAAEHGEALGMGDLCIAVALALRAAGRVLEVDQFGSWRDSVLRFMQVG